MTPGAWWALALLLFLSLSYESAFLFRGLNRLDESWPLYAAMRMHDGGVLYRDVLWVFPPGHVWTAWFAWWLDPPGFVFARVVYGAFDVALVGAAFFIGRRIMPGPFAFLGALLVAFAAPRGHSDQLLFGFRYLVIPVLALLALSRRLDGGSVRWIWLAGALTGLSLTFRPTPAFAAACGVAAGLLLAHRRWQDWIGDGLRYSAALAAVVAPTLLYFHLSVGLEQLWQEVVVHPYAMVEAQSLELPRLEAPEKLDRESIREAFVAFEFRAIWVFYAVYLVGLLAARFRSWREGKPFDYGLLTALVVFGAVYFSRSMGRSDEPHLDSAIPPVCIVVAHTLSLAFARVWPSRPVEPRTRRFAAAGLVVGTTLLWVFLLETDLKVFKPAPMRPVQALDGRIGLAPARESRAFDRAVKLIREYTEPDETILSLSPTPIFHVLTGRTGPGWFDLVMPGTFLDPEDEAWFLDRLRKDPPAVVIWSTRVFDEMPSRAVARVAPRVSRWVRSNYVRAPGEQSHYNVLVRRDRLAKGEGQR